MPEPRPSIPDDIRAYVETQLEPVEVEEGVRVLFVIESGSRAWGFASPDSDFDVRFVYQHPRDCYLSLTEKCDVIERGVDWSAIAGSGQDCH